MDITNNFQYTEQKDIEDDNYTIDIPDENDENHSSTLDSNTNDTQKTITVTQENESNSVNIMSHSRPKCQWFQQFMNWFPLQKFSFFGGLLTIFCGVIDVFLNVSDVSFIGFFVYCYLIFFGVIIVFIESPTFKLTRKIQIKIYFWFRILSRIWGRAYFYLFCSILCFGEVQSNEFVFSGISGFVLLLMAIFSWIISYTTAKKYQRIYIFISSGKEGNERDLMFNQMFDRLDSDKHGFLNSTNIVQLALFADRKLSNAQRHCIQTFLDVSCNGKVSKEDFINQFREYNLKQRFL